MPNNDSIDSRTNSKAAQKLLNISKRLCVETWRQLEEQPPLWNPLNGISSSQCFRPVMAQQRLARLALFPSVLLRVPNPSANKPLLEGDGLQPLPADERL